VNPRLERLGQGKMLRKKRRRRPAGGDLGWVDKGNPYWVRIQAKKRKNKVGGAAITAAETFKIHRYNNNEKKTACKEGGR